MNKKVKGAVTLAWIFLFLYFLNYLHPLSFGDDYLYSFIWQGKPMYTPLRDDAMRVASWQDLFVSQWSHYFTWSGRVVAHVLIQFFLWWGKNVFNFFNALAGTVLVMEIYWCIHKGKISYEFEPSVLCWIFFVLWAFTPGFTPVFLWLTGACNYLWTSVFLLGFIVPYINKYYESQKVVSKNAVYEMIMFLLGVIAGWTNENSVCWIIMVLLVFICYSRKHGNEETWMYLGFVGLVIGYGLLIFAPGNVARLHAEQGLSGWINVQMLTNNLNTFLSISFFQIFLWFFALRASSHLNCLFLDSAITNELKKETYLVHILYIIALGMSAIMIFSPGFPARSGFFGTVQLIIAAGILLRVQKYYGIQLIEKNAKKFLFCVGILYFVMTSTITIYNNYLQKIHMKEIIVAAQQMAREQDNNYILTVKPFKQLQKWEEMASGFHVPGFELTEEENNWINVAFSRYYGIKGIRMEKALSENDENRK